MGFITRLNMSQRKQAKLIEDTIKALSNFSDEVAGPLASVASDLREKIVEEAEADGWTISPNGTNKTHAYAPGSKIGKLIREEREDRRLR